MRGFDEELELYIRSQYPIIAVETHEWKRLSEKIAALASRLGRKLSTWNNIEGLRRDGRLVDDSDDAIAAVQVIYSACVEKSAAVEPELFVLYDFHAYLDRREILGRLRLLAPELKYVSKSIILVGPAFQVPVELQKDLTLLSMPLPDASDLKRTFERFADETMRRKDDGGRESFKERIPADIALEAANAAQGLANEEAYNAFIRSYLETNFSQTKDAVASILAQKEQIIRKGGVLDYQHPAERMEEVGGLDRLKAWLDSRGRAFYAAAKEFGLPEPRGVLLCGVPGCGKSLSAKAIAGRWRLPLLRLDVGRVFEGIVGSSEGNMRTAISLAEAIAPCVLWLDEIEKGFSGVQSSGMTDGGTTARVFGSFLSWMQEKKKPVFVIATANDLDRLPPELLRKGRFDEIFFVDLPGSPERADIFRINIRRARRDPGRFDVAKLAELSQGFNGAEIEAAVQAALFAAFERRDRGDASADLMMKDLLDAIAATVPLSATRRAQIEQMRKVAQGRFVFASSAAPEPIEERGIARTATENEAERRVRLD